MSRTAQKWILGLCVAQLLAPNVPVVAQPQRYVSPDLIKAEARELQAALAPLGRYETRVSDLRKKPRLTPAEVDTLQSDLTAVKAALPQAQRAINAAVAKLKGAGKWTPELDALVEQRMRESGVSATVVQEVRAQGGARALLDKAAVATAQTASELEEELRALQGKTVMSRLIDEVLGVSLHAASGRCLLDYMLVSFCALGRDVHCGSSRCVTLS